MSDEEILALIREAVTSQELPRPAEHTGTIEWETPLTALGVDSIGLLEMAAHIEGKLNIEFSLDQLVRVGCAGDLAALIRAHLAQTSPVSQDRQGAS